MKNTIWIKDFFKKKLEYVTALLAFLLFVAVSLTEMGLNLEYSMYDTLLAIKPSVTERNDVLLINIDDLSIEEIGAWPWTRDILADLLIRLREVKGKSIVFDIEYLTPGQAGINRTYVKNEFPAEYKEVQTEITGYIGDFSGAIATKSIPLSEVPEFGDEMVSYIDGRLTDLSSSITGNIFRDNDVYFGKALRYFGNAYLTINAAKLTSNNELDSAVEFAKKSLLFTNVSDPAGLIGRENEKTRVENDWTKGITPAIHPLIVNSRGSGFPNVIIDEDGVRRRVELLVEEDGAYIGQLVFAPILNILQPTDIVRTRYSLILKNALDPQNPSSQARKDITIPLDEHGRFMINWLKKMFLVADKPDNTSFRHVSSYSFKVIDELEEKLIDNLTLLEDLGIRTAEGYLSYHEAVIWLKDSYRELDGWKKDLLEGVRDDYDAYFSSRSDFFKNYGEFLEGGYDTEIFETFDRISQATGEARFDEYKKNVENYFSIFRKEYAAYNEQFSYLEGVCAGAFAIIGNSATGTSDLGVNPFHKQYPNVGTHANIYNTIMTGQFIIPLPSWVSWIVAFVVCYLSAFLYKRIKSLKGRIVFGFLSILFVFVITALIFAFFRVYLHLFVPLASIALTFVMVSILKFVFSEQEKSFLRKAFTMYLSSDVVNQIVDNPSLLKLGGQERQITALFTDIKSFSSLSEKVTPEHLVEILNKYLTVMSDIVLDQKGTIDKYIGDAIVSFFGAPIDLPDHASRACLAAVRMKQAEETLNAQLLANNETPMPIYTRIGINTGAMVVGNMGTDNKMNYTIMGNDVNLAARLEGVNKSYGTWILVSESTWKETNGMFLGRKLDRVRVVGIDTPVQLYNIMAVRAEASGKMVNLADRFNLAIDAFREKRFSDALLLFNKCLELDADDAPTKIYLERVKDLLKNGVPSDWTDVINMTSK